MLLDNYKKYILIRFHNLYSIKDEMVVSISRGPNEIRSINGL